MTAKPRWTNVEHPALESLDAIWQMINRSRSILLAAHRAPDGDALSSLAALCHVLSNQGHIVHTADVGSPPSYAFLLPLLAQGYSSKKKPDLLIALDTEKLSNLLLPNHISSAEADDLPTVNIDHHSTNTRYGDVNLVDPSASSTSELVFYLLDRAGVDIDKMAAECLLTGIIDDTGRFYFERTSAATLRVAASLVEQGASLNELVDRVSQKHSVASLHLWSNALETIQSEVDGRIVWACVSAGTLADYGTQVIHGDLVNLLLQVETCQLAILFLERQGTIRVSLRATDQVDAAEIAKRFGGGGYARTAGCSVPLPLPDAIAKILQVAKETMGVL